MIRLALALRFASLTSLHAAGLKLTVWTLNEPETAQKLAAAGVDGITTDQPGRLPRELR